MVVVETIHGEKLELPEEVAETLSDNDFELEGLADSEHSKGKPLFTTIQYYKGVWIKVRKDNLSTLAAPRWLEYYEKGSREPDKVYQIRTKRKIYIFK
jgi:hypothetical protein